MPELVIYGIRDKTAGEATPRNSSRHGGGPVWTHLVSEDPENSPVSVPDAGRYHRLPHRLRADGRREEPRPVRVGEEGRPEGLQDGTRHCETSHSQTTGTQHGSPTSSVQFLSWC